MQRLGEEVLTLAAYHIIETVATFGAKLTVALTKDLIDEVLLVGGQVEARVHSLQAPQTYTAADNVEVVEGTAEVTCLGLGFGTDEVHLSQTDVRDADVLVVHLIVGVVEHPLKLAVARSHVIVAFSTKLIGGRPHSAVVPGVDISVACIVANLSRGERLAGNYHRLVEARVAVGKDVDALRVLAGTIDIGVGEVAAVLHTEALHQLVGRNGAALTVAVEGKASPAPAPIVLTLAIDDGIAQVLRGMNIEKFLVALLVVAIAVCATIGHAIAAFVLCLWLNELVVVAIGGIVVEEVVAVLQAAVPERRVFLAEPHVLFFFKAGGALVVGHIRLTAVEQRRGGKHPYLSAQGTGRSASEASGPLTYVGVRNIPDETGLIDGALNERIDKLYGLPGGGTSFGEAFAHAERFLHEAEATEVAESVEIAAGHDGVGLAAQAAFLVLTHILDAVDVLNKLPALAHGLVNRDAPASIRIQATGLCGIREFTLVVTVVGVLGVLGQTAGIVALLGAAPADVAVIGIRQHIDGRAVHHITSGIGAVELSVGAPQEIAGIFGLGEHGVDVHVDARSFLEEGVAHVEFINARREEAGRHSQSYNIIMYLFHNLQ